MQTCAVIKKNEEKCRKMQKNAEKMNKKCGKK